MTLFFGLNPSLQHRRWYVPGSSHSDHPPPECSRTSPSPKHPIWKHVGQPPWFLKIWLNMLQDALLPGTHRMWSNWRKFMSKQTTHVKHLWWAAPHAAGAKFFRKAGDKTQPCSSWAHLPTEHLPFLHSGAFLRYLILQYTVLLLETHTEQFLKTPGHLSSETQQQKKMTPRRHCKKKASTILKKNKVMLLIKEQTSMNNHNHILWPYNSFYLFLSQTSEEYEWTSESFTWEQLKLARRENMQPRIDL